MKTLSSYFWVILISVVGVLPASAQLMNMPKDGSDPVELRRQISDLKRKNLQLRGELDQALERLDKLDREWQKKLRDVRSELMGEHASELQALRNEIVDLNGEIDRLNDKVRQGGGGLAVSQYESITFDPQQHTPLTIAYRALLAQVLEDLEQYPFGMVYVYGYAMRNVPNSLAATQAWAAYVKQELVNMGGDAQRIIPVWYGSSQFLDPQHPMAETNNGVRVEIR